ncbi:hypothetical protein SAMN05444920_1203 [Nonomuraea solani]|uniref:DUF6924 domain-containing protein n=1 Tax=Nonomuraea solani TaxID=1144553 RepID=A0A1H6EWP3_9ACTN|nr:hypothetical protein SAMN05444920_1203 [Nonomuraea solani]
MPGGEVDRPFGVVLVGQQDVAILAVDLRSQDLRPLAVVDERYVSPLARPETYTLLDTLTTRCDIVRKPLSGKSMCAWPLGKIISMSLPQPADLTSLVLRTDFSDDSKWLALQALLDGLSEYTDATYVSDPAYGFEDPGGQRVLARCGHDKQ